MKGAFVMALGGYSSRKLQMSMEEIKTAFISSMLFIPILYFGITCYVWEISNEASGPEFHKMFKITDLVQFNFPVSICLLYVLICKVFSRPCTLCPDLKT